MGHHPARLDVAVEDLAVGGQGVDPFLDARAPRVVQADDGGAHTHGVVHDLADLLGVGLPQGAADDGEILAEDEHLAAVDGAVAGDHPVTRVALVLVREPAAADLEDVELLERALVQQQFDALARGQLALAVLILDPGGSSALEGLVLQEFEL